MNDARNYPYDVFISYRWVTPDQDWVQEKLYPALVQAGLKVFLDVEDFVPGRDLILEMERAGFESRRAICVITPQYFEEGRIAEFERLLIRRRDPGGRDSLLIPLVLSETDIPEHIRGLVPISWVDPKHHTREWKKLLRVLGATNLEAPYPDALEEKRAEQLIISSPESASPVDVNEAFQTDISSQLSYIRHISDARTQITECLRLAHQYRNLSPNNPHGEKLLVQRLKTSAIIRLAMDDIKLLLTQPPFYFPRVYVLQERRHGLNSLRFLEAAKQMLQMGFDPGSVARQLLQGSERH